MVEGKMGITIFLLIDVEAFPFPELLGPLFTKG